VEEKSLLQSDEHEEVILSRVKGGHPIHPRGHDDHAGYTAHGNTEILE